ncbi:3-oxo-isoapionate-4-phosphate transcarboxylase/hydrolase [Paenibacillus solanacearum]|uniref:3-oxo-isoapionate-4-phosphate transcarboxylase/hydrolase n=1 Tax=Paenibacillus solanacearum TaxID=2048548 RepID=A0A916K302_9BACL|nr:ribulose-bisphosphate carboxylase large subunit family protein [Paenibacillus solanacearum]CAG7635782.1 3-oxo-isoapionate-4-phosphate transcarboxylase/hydrolase [Paenibacillus solanacearum]
MDRNRILATYYIETPFPLEYAAEAMAGEQSTGTFVTVPGETPELKEKHGAKVVSVTELEAVRQPSLPGSRLPAGMDASHATYRRAIVTLSFPLDNIGPSLPNLMSTVAGNLYELGEFSGLKLIDLELPNAFADRYPGPAFGIEGTRRLTGVQSGPLVGTIIKPSIGLHTEDYGPLVRQLAEAGIDFIKDDELCANPAFAPLEERVKVVMEEIERVADRTGKKVMYAFNITGDIDELRRNHDLVLKAGGTCVMVCVNSVGFAGTAYLRKYSQLPIHGHRTQWGAMSRSPLLGMSFTVFQKLCRLAGVDHLHTNGLNNKFSEDNETVAQAIRDSLKPFLGGYHMMPVLSSAQWAATAVPTYEAVHSADVISLAGGGILAHPGGIAAGVRSMRQGWEAAVQGVALETYAQSHPELLRALHKFSK